MKMFGMWGINDETVPPISYDPENPDKTIQSNEGENAGWIYTSTEKVMRDWTEGNSCTGSGDMPLTNEYKVDQFNKILYCTQGCSESKAEKHVVGCIFNGGHVCGTKFIWAPAFDFMLSFN